MGICTSYTKLKLLQFILNRKHRSRGTTFHFLPVYLLGPFDCIVIQTCRDLHKLAQTRTNLFRLAQTRTKMTNKNGHLCECNIDIDDRN